MQHEAQSVRGCRFAALAGALGVASVLLERHSVVEAAGVVAPRFEVDPLWPKPLPNHWIMGQTIGVSVDAQDHIWIIHRAGSLEPGETARHHQSARSRNAALPLRRCSNSIRPAISWPLGWSRARLQLAGFESRHHGRLQRQRVDRRERPRHRNARAARSTARTMSRPRRRGQRQLRPAFQSFPTTWC